jgi:hypothetical protein
MCKCNDLYVHQRPTARSPSLIAADQPPVPRPVVKLSSNYSPVP